MANVCNVISAIRKCREGTGRLLYGHPIYKMTGPRSTAITSEAAALDAQARANMQNLLLKAGHRRQDRHADHAFRGGSDLPRLAHRGGDGNCRVTKRHPGARHERVPRAAGAGPARFIFGIITIRHGAERSGSMTILDDDGRYRARWAAGRRPMITSSPTAVKRWSLCRRPTTAKPRWRTSTSHSRRKRCSPHATGNGSTQTARSPIGCSNRPTSSWRMPGSTTTSTRMHGACRTFQVAATTKRSRPFALTFRPFAELPEQSLLLGG